MKLMLDTNTCIYIIKNKPPKVLKHFVSHAVGDIGISSITLAELQYGVAKSRHIQKNKEALDEFMLPLEIADFDGQAAESYGVVRAALEKAGKPVGSMDMLIGAHALCLGVTLVTSNTREFKHINNLRVVDWTM
ncbi:MAG: type II toxin-antitoxin system VapC family toxin [Nitrospiraceae bacterium]|nr:MAG: type II toxin-antitoxin system VapC family toxin [Nitrospiraceae bacterium]